MHAGDPLGGIEGHRDPQRPAFEIGLDDHSRESFLNNGLAVAGILKRPDLADQALPDLTELGRRRGLLHLIGEICLRGLEIVFG